MANPYPYAANDPPNQVDPLGLRPVNDDDLRLGASADSLDPRVRRAIGLSEADRRRIINKFFSAFPGTDNSGFWDFAARNLPFVTTSGNDGLGFGQGIRDFTEWEISSGRLDPRFGSRWWQAVNGLMVLDLQDALGIIDRHGIDAAYRSLAGATSSVRAWVAYATGADGDLSNEAVQRLFWTAHQRSLHAGIAAASLSVRLR